MANYNRITKSTTETYYYFSLKNNLMKKTFLFLFCVFFWMMPGPVAFSQKKMIGQSPLYAIRMVPDKTPPVVYFVSPKLNLREAVQVFRPVLGVQGYLQDENVITSLKLNGATLPVSEDGTFTAQIRLTKGENVLSIEAIDLKGNVLREAYPLILLTDTEPPVVELAPRLQSGTPFRTHAAQFTLTGQVKDENDLRHLKVNGVSVAIQESNFQTSFALSKGKNDVKVEAEDAFGNRFEANYEIIAEDSSTNIAAPVITLIEPELEAIRGMGGKVTVRGDSLLIKGIATDDRQVTTVLVNGKPVALQANGYFKTKLALSEGENTVVVYAQDNDGNLAQQAFLADRPAKVLGRTGQDYALLIATDQYDEWQSLNNPGKDAQTLADLLQNQYGFKTEVLKNPTKEAFLLKIREYMRRSFSDGDQLFIFVAGHGSFDEVEQSGYVVTKDSRLLDVVRSSYISQNYLRETVEKIPANHVFLVMDVCFGGTFDPNLALASDRGEAPILQAEKAAFIQRELQFKTRQFLTSGGKEYVSDGAPEGHSPFTGKLIEALKNHSQTGDIVTIPRLYGYLETLHPKPVLGAFGTNQIRSNFLFIPKVGN